MRASDVNGAFIRGAVDNLRYAVDNKLLTPEQASSCLLQVQVPMNL